jgi:transcriptional regulator with PAS, ATPase and Fis domain
MRTNLHRTLTGSSPAIVRLRLEIERVARSDAKILLVGESGVGKEVVAQTIHARSLRARGPLLTVNCAGMPETLLESELFGHVKGSFTGAYRDKPGKLELADHGTIFLDEIGEMTLHMQGVLLRFLETGELQKVGATGVSARVDVRVIAATNRNLRDMIALGSFREDLFYRLNVIHLLVPPLRERRQDIAEFVQAFLDEFTRHNDCTARAISPDALHLLERYRWPGNVRELVNVVERLVVTGGRDTIEADDLPAEIRSERPSGAERPDGERRRTIADDLFKKLTDEHASFWTTVYPLYMQREITRGQVRDVVRKGLEQARGNYKIVTRMFNMDQGDYKRFLNFLRKHDCQVPFRHYR